MNIQGILDRKSAEVITIRATATVRNAADRMRERSIAALVVKSGDESPASYQKPASYMLSRGMGSEPFPWRF